MSSPTTDTREESGNAYEVVLSRRRRAVLGVVSGIGLALAVVAGFLGPAPTLWGLLPIVLYAVLCLLGMDIVVATVVALVSGLLVAQLSPLETGNLLGEGLGDSITMIGLIIVLGAATGEVLKVTGVAQTIVSWVMRMVGESSRTAVLVGMMLACLVLVAALGTLAGALAIAAPILLPIAARLGFTRSATAAALFIGGCAGLAVAPFAGSNVAVMTAAEVGYLTYLGYGAAPLAVLSIVWGVVVVRWMQRRTEGTGDDYDPASIGAETTEVPARAGRATAVFTVALLVSVVYATVTEAGTSFPLLALPVLGVLTGLAGGLEPGRILSAMYRGGASLISILILFWLLAALFAIIDLLAPFDVVLAAVGDDLAQGSAFAFTLVVAALGWVGVPGATAAQVVLLDEVFGPLQSTLGVSAGAWVVTMLFASKADTYGPFPNGNMVGAMGLARSTNLRNMLITGWAVLVPACAMYALILWFTT
ncbi:permease [Auraticoccus sp. F435]|uniref:Permease n=1 Tax=Auraticoccus cholistanensis TaxID=2656650 RepID=A0A6A9V1T0_9ACTN|nr:Na+/H+ antiporter NhaC family protein [Auraticoccus cholistanensis]MVA77551.1 permease [Auraticoccus cholistanensis]